MADMVRVRLKATGGEAEVPATSRLLDDPRWERADKPARSRRANKETEAAEVAESTEEG